MVEEVEKGLASRRGISPVVEGRSRDDGYVRRVDVEVDAWSY